MWYIFLGSVFLAGCIKLFMWLSPDPLDLTCLQVTTPIITVLVWCSCSGPQEPPLTSGLRQRTISPVRVVTCSGFSKGSCGPSQNVGEITPWGGGDLINMEQNQQINRCISSPIPSNELFSNTVLPIWPSKRLPTRPDQAISPVC